MSLSAPLDKIIPLTDARDNFSKIVADIEKTPDGMYVLTKGGKPAVAIININYLETLTGGPLINSGKDKDADKAKIQPTPAIDTPNTKDTTPSTESKPAEISLSKDKQIPSQREVTGSANTLKTDTNSTNNQTARPEPLQSMASTTQDDGQLKTVPPINKPTPSPKPPVTPPPTNQPSTPQTSQPPVSATPMPKPAVAPNTSSVSIKPPTPPAPPIATVKPAVTNSAAANSPMPPAPTVQGSQVDPSWLGQQPAPVATQPQPSVSLSKPQMPSSAPVPPKPSNPTPVSANIPKVTPIANQTIPPQPTFSAPAAATPISPSVPASATAAPGSSASIPPTPPALAAAIAESSTTPAPQPQQLSPNSATATAPIPVPPAPGTNYGPMTTPSGAARYLDLNASSTQPASYGAIPAQQPQQSTSPTPYGQPQASPFGPLPPMPPTPPATPPQGPYTPAGPKDMEI